MHPPELPPLSRLERLVLDAGCDVEQGSFDEHCERFRQYLRDEIDRRTRELARMQRVEAFRDGYPHTVPMPV